MARTVPCVAMAAVDVITEYVDSLPGDTRRVAHLEWGVTLDEERGGGWPLDLGMRLADGLLRVQAFALPYREDLDFGQVLHWNRQTRIARFACTRSGDIWVQADLPAEAVSAEQLDRLLGLVVEGALNVRAYAAALDTPDDQAGWLRSRSR
jgi:Putative bacterial sensory transduction regulator